MKLTKEAKFKLQTLVKNLREASWTQGEWNEPKEEYMGISELMNEVDVLLSRQKTAMSRFKEDMVSIESLILEVEQIQSNSPNGPDEDAENLVALCNDLYDAVDTYALILAKFSKNINDYKTAIQPMIDA
jgi:hypothetical protein